jgi:hypothetical protein
MVIRPPGRSLASADQFDGLVEIDRPRPRGINQNGSAVNDPTTLLGFGESGRGAAHLRDRRNGSPSRSGAPTFKVGVTLSQIARQFGLSQADVRQALASGSR